jgi:hypothetical protein
MATPSIVGVRRGEHWHGTYVGYDGGLEALGTKLLELVVEWKGDLEAVWAHVASAPDGWRFAFTEPYEPEFNDAYFETGRTGLGSGNRGSVGSQSHTGAPPKRPAERA